METYEAIKKRVSIREYEKKPVDKKDLERLVDAGRRAATARAVEPWEFIVITEPMLLSEIGEAVSPNGAFLKEAAACIVIVANETKYYLEDCCAATENILLQGENTLTFSDFGQPPGDIDLFCKVYPVVDSTSSKNGTYSISISDEFKKKRGGTVHDK